MQSMPMRGFCNRITAFRNRRKRFEANLFHLLRTQGLIGRPICNGIPRTKTTFDTHITQSQASEVPLTTQGDRRSGCACHCPSQSVRGVLVTIRMIQSDADFDCRVCSAFVLRRCSDFAALCLLDPGCTASRTLLPAAWHHGPRQAVPVEQGCQVEGSRGACCVSQGL